MELDEVSLMKKSVIALVLAFLCLLSACGGSAKDPAFDTVVSAVAGCVANTAMADMEDNYIKNMLKLSPEEYESCSVRIANMGTSIDEYGVLRGKDAAQTASLKEAVDAYLELREKAWMPEYLPEEYPKLENAEVWTQGNYVVYVILSDAEKAAAKSAFSSCFEA